MSIIVLDDKTIVSNDKSYFVVWRTKAGHPIPIFGRGEKHWTRGQTAGYNKSELEKEQKRKGLISNWVTTASSQLTTAEKTGDKAKIREAKDYLDKAKKKQTTNNKKVADLEARVKSDEKAGIVVKPKPPISKPKEPVTKPIVKPIKKEDAKEKMLREGKIVESTPIGMGVTNPTLVTFEDGSQGVFKPPAQLGTRFGVPPSNTPKNEVAAYELDKALGLNIVPPTVSRDFQGQRGSMQRFVPGHKTAEEHSGKIDRNGFEKMRALDVLTWSMDRHDGNYLVSKGGKVKAIDNGLSLPPKVKRGKTMYSPDTEIMNVPRGKTLNYDSRSKIPPNIMTGLRGLTDTKIKQALLSSGNTSGKVFSGIKKRRDILLDVGQFPSVASMNSNMEGWF